MRILLVEDNPLVQEQMLHWLGLLPGAQVVHVAPSAGAAGDWLAANRDGWDLAVIDLFLSHGHGFEVLRHCRDRQPHQRAVVLSNYTRDPVREHARRAGADAVFDKAYEMDALARFCRQLHAAVAG